MSVKKLSCFMLRRVKFEALLASYQAEVDKFQELEVPRQVEEIKKVVEQLDTLSSNLEAAKEEAMVRYIQLGSCVPAGS